MFASPQNRGKNPYWGQQLLRHHIRPVAQEPGITKRIGWHTFRRTYSTLLRATGAELKVMQELMRHSTVRVTLDTYTQAVTSKKRAAQTAVVSLLVRNKIRREARPASESAEQHSGRDSGSEASRALVSALKLVPIWYLFVPTPG